MDGAEGLNILIKLLYSFSTNCSSNNSSIGAQEW